MKIRSGFVSNSSSSSFVAVVLQDEYDKLISKMNELEALIFNDLISKPKKFGDTKVFVINRVTGEACYWSAPKGAEKVARKVLKEMGETHIDRDYIDEIISEAYYGVAKFIEDLPSHKRIIHDMYF